MALFLTITNFAGLLPIEETPFASGLRGVRSPGGNDPRQKLGAGELTRRTAKKFGHMAHSQNLRDCFQPGGRAILWMTMLATAIHVLADVGAGNEESVGVK